MKKYSVIACDCPWAAGDKLRMSSVKRGAAANYNVISTDDLCALPVKDIADPNGCVLALWVLGSMLEDGMRVMKAWGFEQKQVYVWVKTKKHIFEPEYREMKKNMKNSIKFLFEHPFSPSTLKTHINDVCIAFAGRLTILDLKKALSFYMGRMFRQTHEICLIGINNTGIYKKLKNKSQRSVSFAENKGHSIKPEALQDSLDIMFPKVKKIEMFARRERKGWDVIGNEVSNGKDIRVSLNEIIDKIDESPTP